MNLLEVANPEGGFGPAQEVKGSPVPNEEVMDNIKKSYEIPTPLFEKFPPREGSFIFVAGGPTTLEFIEEIRTRKKNGEFICTSNNTHDFLVKNGIIPDACLLMDPKEIVKEYIKLPNKETTYYVGTVCNPQVAKGLLEKGMNVVKLLVAFGIEGEPDVTLQKEMYHTRSKSFLVGGTMTGLRAMNFAMMCGFSKIEYYGFDSGFRIPPERIVFKEDPEYPKALARQDGRYYSDTDTGRDYVIDDPKEGGMFYAYKKNRKENILVADVGGKRYLTSPVFAHQAKQFPKWVDKLEGRIEVVVHGDSLSSVLINAHRESNRRAQEAIGDRRWTDEYYELQKKFHDSTKQYGNFGFRFLETVGRAILPLYYRLRRPITILDYGCGTGSLKNALESAFHCIEVTRYDPFVEEFSKEPEGQYDIVCCFDVMEHVERQCVRNTLKYIKDRCKYIALFDIALDDAVKTLPDGRNAHITLRTAKWWAGMLKDYFVVREAVSHSPDERWNRPVISAACQAMEADVQMEKESKIAWKDVMNEQDIPD